MYRTSIIRNLDYPALHYPEPRLSDTEMGVLTAVTMDTGMFIFCACADTHMHCSCLSIRWVDQGVVYPFDYIRPAKVSG